MVEETGEQEKQGEERAASLHPSWVDRQTADAQTRAAQQDEMDDGEKVRRTRAARSGGTAYRTKRYVNPGDFS